jgi:hypothetical protein
MRILAPRARIRDFRPVEALVTNYVTSFQGLTPLAIDGRPFGAEIHRSPRRGIQLFCRRNAAEVNSQGREPLESWGKGFASPGGAEVISVPDVALVPGEFVAAQ